MSTTKRKPTGKTLRHYFDTVFAPARLAGRAQTIRLYDLELRRLEKYLGREPLLSDLNNEIIHSAIVWSCNDASASHLGGRPLSKPSATKFRDCILCLWKYLHLQRIVEHYPSVPDIVIPKRIPTALTRDELNRLWEYLKRLPGDVAGVPANLWFLSLVSVLWDSGERITPIRTAKWDQLDLASGYLICKAESRKGGLADKLHKLHPETCALLRQITEPRRGLIFYWPWSESCLYARWREILQRAGLRSGRDFMFHCIRKSVASHVKAAGGNAQEALGHYDPRMTEQVYIDPRIAPNQHAADVLFRLHDAGKEGSDHAA